MPESIDPVQATALIMLKENLSLLHNSDVAGRSVAIVGTGPAAQAETIFARALGARGWSLAAQVATPTALTPSALTSTWPAMRYQRRPRARLQEGGFDRVFEAVGSREALAHCLGLVSANGRVCVYGIPPQSETHPQLSRPTGRDGQRSPKRRPTTNNCKLVASGEVRLDEWISHVLPWQEFQQGFDLIWGKVANKVVLTFD